MDPLRGHDLLWLVRTGGQWPCARICDELLGYTGYRMIATLAEAMVPGTDTYEDMVLIHAPHPAAAAALRDLGGRGIVVAGCTLEVYPLTRLRPLMGGGLGEPRGAREMWNVGMNRGSASA